MNTQSYGEKRAKQAAQVALEFARQMGGTFVTNSKRKDSFVSREVDTKQAK